AILNEPETIPAVSPDPPPLPETPAATIRAELVSRLKSRPATLDELAASFERSRGQILDEPDAIPEAKRNPDGQYWIEPTMRLEDVVADRERIRTTKELEAWKEKYKAALQQLNDAEAQRDAILATIDPVEPIRIEPDLSIDGGQAVALWQASDWHVGERVDPSTINY